MPHSRHSRVFDLERALGFNYKRSISHKRPASNPLPPPVQELQDHITALKHAYANKQDIANRDLAKNQELGKEITQLFQSIGPKLWPDDRRPSVTPWLAQANEDDLDGLYPRDLFYTRESDRAGMLSTFHDMVITKCCIFRDNLSSASRREVDDDTSLESGCDDDEPRAYQTRGRAVKTQHGEHAGHDRARLSQSAHFPREGRRDSLLDRYDAQGGKEHLYQGERRPGKKANDARMRSGNQNAALLLAAMSRSTSTVTEEHLAAPSKSPQQENGSYLAQHRVKSPVADQLPDHFESSSNRLGSRFRRDETRPSGSEQHEVRICRRCREEKLHCDRKIPCGSCQASRSRCDYFDRWQSSIFLANNSQRKCYAEDENVRHEWPVNNTIFVSPRQQRSALTANIGSLKASTMSRTSADVVAASFPASTASAAGMHSLDGTPVADKRKRSDVAEVGSKTKIRPQLLEQGVEVRAVLTELRASNARGEQRPALVAPVCQVASYTEPVRTVEQRIAHAARSQPSSHTSASGLGKVTSDERHPKPPAPASASSRPASAQQPALATTPQVAPPTPGLDTNVQRVVSATPLRTGAPVSSPGQFANTPCPGSFTPASTFTRPKNHQHPVQSTPSQPQPPAPRSAPRDPIINQQTASTPSHQPERSSPAPGPAHATIDNTTVASSSAVDSPECKAPTSPVAPAAPQIPSRHGDDETTDDEEDIELKLEENRFKQKLRRFRKKRLRAERARIGS